jgi:hypothetical protein
VFEGLVGIGIFIMETLGSTTNFPLDLGIVEDACLEVKYAWVEL